VTVDVELKVTPDKYLPHRYAGASGDFNPIHIDREFAQQVGLPSNILHGLYSMAPARRPPAATRARCAACRSSSGGWGCPSRRSS
jgi:acyl dehydratase